mmetsp:Transcript_31131/g.28328  ORF Transcript_31131/g.28328 Transcript_31131/m.28328 type:complete len:155 (-) Transcript_31131:1309-1773(-)
MKNGHMQIVAKIDDAYGLYASFDFNNQPNTELISHLIFEIVDSEHQNQLFSYATDPFYNKDSHKLYIFDTKGWIHVNQFEKESGWKSTELAFNDHIKTPHVPQNQGPKFASYVNREGKTVQYMCLKNGMGRFYIIYLDTLEYISLFSDAFYEQK